MISSHFEAKPWADTTVEEVVWMLYVVAKAAQNLENVREGHGSARPTAAQRSSTEAQTSR